MKHILKAIDNITEQSAILSGFMVGVMMLLMSYEICMRYFFNSPTAFAYDVTEYIIVYATFMAAPWLLKSKVHVRVTIFTEHLSTKAQIFLEMVTSILGFGVCAVMCFESTADVWELIRDNIWVMRPFSIPKFITRLPIPFGTFFLAVYFVEIFYDMFIKLKRQKIKPGENGASISESS